MVAEQAMLQYDCALLWMTDKQWAPRSVAFRWLAVLLICRSCGRSTACWWWVSATIGSGHRWYEKAKALGFAFPNIVAPSAYISPYAKLGCGCVVLQNACIQNGASVGNGVLLNAGTEVHCDAAVGDYALIYTNSVIRTGATVGNFARIGSNCTICNHATVRDGADIPDCTAVH